MTFIVATNVVASGPPERRPTGMPHARANLMFDKLKFLPNIVLSLMIFSKSFYCLFNINSAHKISLPGP